MYRRVLDLYSYLGGFGIQAAVAGAAKVVCVDRSEAARGRAEQAAQRNDVADRCGDGASGCQSQGNLGNNFYLRRCQLG